jgi:uracil-DNA glycosylase family 4
MTGGFFTRKETESKTRPTGKTFSCSSCGLYRGVESPRMEPQGNFTKGIMNIGDFPNETEDRRGEYWKGATGRLLARTYDELGIDIFEDCININAVSCSPEKAPTTHQLDCCRTIKVLKAIEKYQPKIIIVLGDHALYSIIGNRWKKDLDKIDKWRGFTIPDQALNAWVCPTFNPSFVDRVQRPEVETVWKQDLSQAFDKIDEPVPIFKEPEIEIITDLRAIEYSTVSTPAFGKVKAHVQTREAAFDYETTGLKPHAPGHKIICASIADTDDHAFAFMIPETRKELRPFLNFLSDETIHKIAANMKYEHVWSAVRFKTEVKGWIWDTMQATHQIDNRSGVTGLKFQTYVNFGIIDYDSEVAPYLRPKVTTSANDINRIEELLVLPGGKEKLLKYCAWDSILEKRLANIQRNILK